MGHTRKTLKYERINYIVNITFKLVKIKFDKWYLEMWLTFY